MPEDSVRHTVVLLPLVNDYFAHWVHRNSPCLNFSAQIYLFLGAHCLLLLAAVSTGLRSCLIQQFGFLTADSIDLLINRLVQRLWA